MEYYSAIKKNTFESVLMRWMKLEPIIQSEVSQKEKHQYSILTHIYGFRKMVMMTLYARQLKRHRYKEDFWTLWDKARVGWFERIALKYVYYHMWNGSPVQVWHMNRAFKASALGLPWGMGWGGRWEGGSGWGTHVHPWLIHVSVWQKPLQYCKAISLQLK